MFPGMGGMNPAQMQKIMQQMGIRTSEIKAKRIIFETDDGNLVIENPQITKMTIQGTETYQVVGSAKLEEQKTRKPKEIEITDEDIEMVAQQAHVSRSDAKKALEKTKGDIAEAIVLAGK